MELRLHTISAFPNFRTARVVWMGVDPSPRLELLQHDMEVAMNALGHGLDGRPFRPHVTLARVPEPMDDSIRRPLVRAARRIDFAGTEYVTGVSLLESTRDTDGLRYRRLHWSPLQGE